MFAVPGVLHEVDLAETTLSDLFNDLEKVEFLGFVGLIDEFDNGGLVSHHLGLGGIGMFFALFIEITVLSRNMRQILADFV